MKVIPTVISQHAEGAAMLWLLRSAAVAAPHYSLADLGKLDGRVEAHLDGLRIAGDDGWTVCEEQLAANEAGEIFAAGVLACESANPQRFAKVLAVVEADPLLAGALVSAMGWPTFEQVESQLQNLIGSGDPIHQLIGIGAAAIHRRYPGDVLRQLVRSKNPLLRARALKAVGELSDQTLTYAIKEGLSDPDIECRFAAAWAGALFGSPEAIPVLQQIAETVPSYSIAAAGLAVRGMDVASAVSWQKRLAADPKLLRTAISFAGAIGDPSLVPWLISLMGELPIARLAGEAFTMITGVGLAYQDLERKPPEDFNAGPTEDPKDESVEMDAEENLPWPEPRLIANWWQKNLGQFQSGTRYLCGKPMTIEWLQQVLRDGYQRQRAAAALKLAIRQSGTPLFNVEAPGFRQIQLLGKPGASLR